MSTMKSSVRFSSAANAPRGRRMSVMFVTPPSQEEEQAKKKKITWILWRDLLFFVMAAIAGHYISYVELHASEAELRGGTAEDYNNGIVDTGYIATTKLHEFLKDSRKWNDILAAMNSLVLLLPGIYTAYVTLIKGDYDLAFRYLACHLLRSFCGWFTYLPPDPGYLPSNYDFPDIMQCLFVKDCSKAATPEVLPFVSFFSGHVATLVTTANHMYLHGYLRLGLFMHVANVLQIGRLLATRGHFSIDIIIAWYVTTCIAG